MPELTLHGCAPVPLAHYLKALGILRLTSESEHGDTAAKACWNGNQLVLNSRFDRVALLEFFLKHYAPTAVLAPWNGGSGFYRSDKRTAINAIRYSKAVRFKAYKTAILIARAVLASQVAKSRKTSRYTSQFGSILRTVDRQTFDNLAKAALKGLTSNKPEKKADPISALVSALAADSSVVAKTEGLEPTSKQLLEFWKAVGYQDRKRILRLIKGSIAFREEARGGREKALGKLLDVELAETKSVLLEDCRNNFPDDALGWLDAVVVLSQDSPKFPPLLGTGGNDGRLEFTNNFMQRIIEVIDPASGEPTGESERWLRAALFAEAAPGLATKAPIGQFFPGAAGGANGTSGFDAPAAVNPWDYILMIEGALLFAAASVKRLESTNDGSLVYPFCVRQAGVGYASAAGADEAEARCEMWMPLWSEPTTLMELRAIFSEGRAQVLGRAARTGVDFSQAAVTLGVDRGIAAFQRFGFQVRNGLAYFATPLERVIVRRNARVDLLGEIEHWHDRLRQKAGPRANPAPPASVARALNHLERRIVELCRDDSPASLQSLLASLGATERALARSFKWTKEAYLRPLHGLRLDWLVKANDGSVEFRLAQSLAGMRAWLGKETLWFREQLEPLSMSTTKECSWASWADIPTNDVAWHDGDLADALNDILARRLVRVEKSGARGWPDWSPRTATLGDVTAFIECRINDALLSDLIWGMSLVDWVHIPEERNIEAAEEAIPSSFYALLRLCFRRSGKDEDSIPLVPAILHRAINGQGKESSVLAARRLRASGRAPLVDELPVAGDIARRAAAAILFPISPRDFSLLERMTLKQPVP